MESVVAIHERLLAEHGGAVGIRDEGLLEGALAAPRNRYSYERADVFALAASYPHAITRNHPFMDGNKRVALTVSGVFLELNGYRLESPEGDAAAAIVALVERKMSEAGFAEWLRSGSKKKPRAPKRRGR